MHVLIIYDITSDRIRNKIVTACEDYGLDRVQYSAFYGLLGRNYQEELMLRIAALLGQEPGRVQLIAINTQDWERRLEVGTYVG